LLYAGADAPAKKLMAVYRSIQRHAWKSGIGQAEKSTTIIIKK